MENTDRGQWAERQAERWLVLQGLTPYLRNFRCRVGEIDLVMQASNPNTWVFVEVKYRQLDAIVSGVDAISFHKQKRLLKTAEYFLQRDNQRCHDARIDAVVLTQHCGSDQPFQVNPIDGYCEQVANGYHLQWIKNAIERG